jgi:hypothetical protein
VSRDRLASGKPQRGSRPGHGWPGPGHLASAGSASLVTAAADGSAQQHLHSHKKLRVSSDRLASGKPQRGSRPGHGWPGPGHLASAGSASLVTAAADGSAQQHLHSHKKLRVFSDRLASGRDATEAPVALRSASSARTGMSGPGSRRSELHFATDGKRLMPRSNSTLERGSRPGHGWPGPGHSEQRAAEQGPGVSGDATGASATRSGRPKLVPVAAGGAARTRSRNVVKVSKLPAHESY